MIRFTSDFDECRRLWEQFSPHERAWDEWDVMWAFHDQSSYRLHFMVHERDGRADGLIPLVQEGSDGRYELFGGSYPDARVLWIELEDFPSYFDSLPENTVFFDLSGKWVRALLDRYPDYAENFGEVDQQFYLVPADFGYDFNNHIQTFSNDKRKGFLRDLRRLREIYNPELRWSDDDEADLFISLSQKNFGAESDHVTEGGKQEVRRVVRELKALGYLRTLTISIDGVKQAASLSAHFKNMWVSLYACSNNDFNNLGKFLNVETIQEGARRRVDEINYMTGMTWKAAWHMKENPCNTMRKPPKPAAKPGTDHV